MRNTLDRSSEQGEGVGGRKVCVQEASPDPRGRRIPTKASEMNRPDTLANPRAMTTLWLGTTGVYIIQPNIEGPDGLHRENNWKPLTEYSSGEISWALKLERCWKRRAP